MRIIKPGFELCEDADYVKGCYVDKIAKFGRIAYQSDKTTDNEEFVAALIKNKHESVLEHASLSVIITCNRGVSHELVRHRIASYTQESTRYCNYSNEKFGKCITFIKPMFLPNCPEGVITYKHNTHFDAATLCWLLAMLDAEAAYFELLDYDFAPQLARDVLGNALKTQVGMTANLREWRHILALRAVGTTGKPHPQMQEIMLPILYLFKELLPAVFEDLS